MTGTVTLRDATTGDASAILDVLRAANREYLPLFTSGSFTDTVEGTRAMLAKTSAILAVTDDGEIVGCVFCAPEGDHWDLFRLGVLPTHRRRGIGRALVAAVEDRARAHGARAIRLGARHLLPQNRSYYERLGYHLLPEQGSDISWKMEKHL
jgi:ribosomal protein S18 acetylase RimI-like enzyme